MGMGCFPFDLFHIMSDLHDNPPSLSWTGFSGDCACHGRPAEGLRNGQRTKSHPRYREMSMSEAVYAHLPLLKERPEDFYVLFASHGYGVLAWDFHAHGKSGGEFSSLGYYEVRDVKAALDYALAQPDVKHIGAWGGSMGAVTMIRAAAQYPQIEALVADSPFSTLEDEFDLRVPYPVIRPLIRFFAEMEIRREHGPGPQRWTMSTRSARPVYIIQGMGDAMLPLNSAQRIFDAAGEPKFLWMEADVPHLNMYAYYRERYTKRVIKFFDEYLLEK